MIIYDHPVKIFYKDVDQMGIVYYSRYFEYFEEARTELLASVGLGVTEVEKKGIMLPVISSHCDYLRGARFEQNIIIQASISSTPRSRLHIDYSVCSIVNIQIVCSSIFILIIIYFRGRSFR